jgi:hypothetical protein
LVNSDEPGSFGPASPFAFLQRHNGVLLAIDLPLDDALTYAHYVEEQVGVPYRRQEAMRFHYTDAAGATAVRTFSLYAKKPGHHMDFAPLEPLLQQARVLAHGEVDGSRYLRVDLPRAHAVIATDIQRNAARSIHRFTWKWWLRDGLKELLRRFGVKAPGR